MVSEGIPIGESVAVTVNRLDLSGITSFVFLITLIVVFIFLIARKKNFKGEKNELEKYN